MKNYIKIGGIVFLIMTIGISSVACGKSSALVGKWENNDSLAPSFAWYHIPKKMELFRDGTGVVDGMSTPWKVENNHLILNVGGMLSVAYSYEITGAELVLIKDKDDETATYTKQPR